MATVTSDPLVGRLVDGRYEVVSRIARGGMATVYLAVDRRLDREVALKVMHAHLADGSDGSDFVSRFRREARAAARLTHPGLVAVYDQGVDGETSYLTMEYVPGSNLRRLLRTESTLSVGRTLTILEEILDALAAAHRKDLVHRDIKPENVLIGPDGRIKVADFGLARAVTEVTSTSTGTILGTVAYLSPELIATGVCDTRTDVYSVGILAYEMLTGSQPFVGESPIQVAFQHVNADIPAPSDTADWLPAEIDVLVCALAARNPSDRPPDAVAALELVRATRRELDEADLERRGERPPPPVPADKGTNFEDDGAGEDPTTADDEPPLDAIPTAAFSNLSGMASAGGTLALAADMVRAPRESLDQETQVVRRPRRRGVLRLLAVLLVFVGLGAGTAWWFMAGPGAYTSVPDGLVGISQTDAQDALAAVGLRSDADENYHDTVPAGDVIETDPASGAAVRKEGSVRLVVSRGIQMFTVPAKLVGVSHDEATAALEAAGFTVADPEAVYDDTIAAGTVMAVSAPEGSEQRHDTTVTLTVSQGPAPVTIPQVVGTAKDDAISTLKDKGLVPQPTEENSNTVAAGRVISQTPENGTGGHRGDKVALVISLGPPLVEVPDVVGMNTAAATEALAKAGLKVEENKYLGGIFDLVRFQNEDPKTKIPEGSTVTITIW